MDKNALFRDPKKPPESVKKTPKKALFWPPRNPQFWPLLDNSWPLFGPQIWPPKCQFLTKTPKTTLFRPPPDSKNPGKWPFWRKPGFSSKIWTAKRGGGWGFTQGPPKKAIFGHFWPFLAIFGHFWPPKWTHPDPPKRPPFLPPFYVSGPPKTPLAARTISNNRVIRPQIWNLRRKRGFFCTPTGAGNVSESGRNSPIIILKY